MTSGWSNDITLLPSLSWRDVTEYLIDTPSKFTKEALKAYKSLEAYNYFICNHVHDCYYHEVSKDSELCFIKSEVLPSQRQGEKTTLYKVWVCLNKKFGWFLTGNCTCMAGLGSACSHLAALLFKLEAAVHYNLNEKTASTSQLRSWNAARKHVTPAPASVIDFSRPKKRTLPKYHEKIRSSTNFSCEDPTIGEGAIPIEKFSELYNIFPKAAVFTSLPIHEFTNVEENKRENTAAQEMDGSDTDSDIESDPSIIPEHLTSLFDPTAVNMDDFALDEHARKQFNLYRENNFKRAFDNLRKLTEKQSLNPAWMMHRAERITASICSKVSRMKDSKSLISNIMQYNDGFTSKFTDFGKTIEPLARSSFIKTEEDKHANFSVILSGLIVNAEEPYLGASPDGIVTCSCHGKGVLEIKCPFNYKDGFDGWQHDKNFPLASLGPGFIMKKNHLYYYQIQLQMELSGAEFGYFYIFVGNKKEGMICPVGKKTMTS
ncbi:uncharacterized protein LOC135693861 [Rhopilema esculentum]|uniref:uncharacterized protein LOC135693861 n=1 Tax=Rhopilema esculentum TaxID=499914 RepID=UPI0031D54A1B|eukprot:gene9999-18626_t